MMKIRNIIAVAVLLTSCSAERIYKIGVSQCGAGQWREKVNQEMLAAQHLYEEDVKVSIACAYDDTEWQIRQIDSLADSGIDLLVVAPNEAAPVSEAIARTRKKGIPVVYFDRKAETDDYTAFIGGNNVWAGQTVADYALTLARQMEKPRPVVMEITATMGTSPARERHEGFAQVLSANAAVEYVCINSDWSSEQAYAITQRLIAADSLPDILFCHNDGMTTGVWRALEEAGMQRRVMLLGVDGMPDEGISFVRQGTLDGTYVYPTHGEEVVRLALDILTGHDYERDNSMRGQMVTPENVELVELNSRELMKQNHDLITIHDKLEESLVQYDTQHKILLGSLVAIALLIVAVMLAIRAWLQTRKTIRQRQTMNEEQTLFYTDPSARRLHDIFDKPEDDLPPPRSQDVLFAEQLNEAIRKHMSNPNLKMEDLGEEIGLGRVQLYRKVKAITGQTPVELLRQMRLQRAYALLGSTTKTVAEIAFEVGFNTPGYFSKCFKEQYGKLPMELRETKD